MRALVTQVKSDPVVLGNEVLDRGVDVREGVPPSPNSGFRLLGGLAARLIDDIEDAAIERLIDEPVQGRLVRLGVR